MDAMKINDEVTVGPQPTGNQLKELANAGFKSIINFRTEGEEDQPLSPTQEGENVKQLGLSYLHIPVSMKSMSEETVDQLREQFHELPKPVFAHCKSGKRAGAMVMMHMASKQGLSGKQTLQQAEQMGFKCDQPELKQFVETYVDNHAMDARS